MCLIKKLPKEKHTVGKISIEQFTIYPGKYIGKKCCWPEIVPDFGKNPINLNILINQTFSFRYYSMCKNNGMTQGASTELL